MRHAARSLMSMARVGGPALAATVLMAAAVLPSAPAAAGPTASGLAAQAGSLQASLVSTGRQLHALATSTAAASARLTATSAAVQRDASTLEQVQAQLASATTTLRAVALQAYMRDSSAGTSMAIFDSTPTESAALGEYTAIAGRTEADAIDRFRRASTVVAQQEAAMRTEQAAASAAYHSLEQRYSALQQTVAHEQQMLVMVQHQQTVLAQQQAAARQQAIAAAAAAAARQQAAAQAAAQGAPLAVNVGVLVPTGGSMSQDLARLRQCESGGNYQADTGNGYYGAYQFALSTWQDLGYSGLPSDAPPAVQDQAAMRLERADGWGQWPVCSAMLGLH